MLQDMETIAAPARTGRPLVTTPRPPARDRFVDAVRALALLAVVFGHWLATLPRATADGGLAGADHLLAEWGPAGYLTWALQVVPLFVFVSAAVTPVPAPGRRRAWWLRRAVGLAVPAGAYLAAVTALLWTSPPVVRETFSTSVTVHLWFVLMLLAVQALLPLAARADARWGWRAPAVLLVAVVAVDGLRVLLAGGPWGVSASSSYPWIGAVNLLLVWLLPQQVGLRWRAGALDVTVARAALAVAGLVALLAGVALGYPVSLVGADLGGSSNVLPPTVMLAALASLHVGTLLLLEAPARRVLERPRVWRWVKVASAVGMPLYLWHKAAEPVVALGAHTMGVLGWFDRGLPGDAWFWTGRVVWLTMLAVVCAVLLRVASRVTPTCRAAGAGGVAVAGVVLALVGIGLALAAGLAGPVGLVAVGCVLAGAALGSAPTRTASPSTG